MANICCSYDEPCESLITIGYLKELASSDTRGNSCFSVFNGSPYTNCCSGSGENYVPDYDELSGGTFAALRTIDDIDPNNDTSGFVYVTPQWVSGACAPESPNVGTKNLTKADAEYRYTKAISNDLDVVTQPTVCDVGYEVKEIKTYTRNSIYCGGNSGETVTVFVKHSNNDVADTAYTEVKDDGVIEKDFSKSIESNGVIWDVSFTPSTKIISGLTSSDCGEPMTKSIQWDFSNYSVGYEIECPTEEIPCTGGTIILTFTANTECENDFMIEVSALYDEVIHDPTLSSSSGFLSIYQIEIEIPQNHDNHTGGTITINYSGGSSTTGETSATDIGFTTCEYDRQLCAWSARNVTDPDVCSAFWPTIGWEDVTGEIDLKDKDVIEISHDRQIN